MHRSVIEAWFTFSHPLEGRVHWMYLDVLGFVTAGVGNLADPLSLALNMPWRRLDGSRATVAEVEANWTRLKERQDLRDKHYSAAKSVTSLRLTDADIDDMVRLRLAANAEILRRTFTEWDRLPADAQLGLSSMAWAMGAGFPAEFPRFTACARAGDWSGAIEHCTIREAGNAGVVPRNAANRLCFGNAARVLERGLDPAILHWPGSPPAPAVGPEAPENQRPVAQHQPDPNWEAVDTDRARDVRENNS